MDAGRRVAARDGDAEDLLAGGGDASVRFEPTGLPILGLGKGGLRR
jgi:hypothetical protein